MRKHLPYLAAIVVFGAFLIASIFTTGWHSSHDGVYHILRTEEAWKMLRLGHFPLRWAGHIDQGFGIPLFNFIYPLPYYITAIFSAFIGSVWAVKTVMIASYLLGGLGIYALFAKKDKVLATGLALIYLMTPYQFLNFFVRGALGEIVALGLMPWALYAFESLKDGKSKLTWYHPLPLALTFLAHNFLGILFAIFLLGYSLFAKVHKSKLWLSLLLSLGLASFFLLPMIMERGYLYSLDNQFFTFRFDQHFVYVKQLLYGKWDYWYSLPGPDDGMSFQLGIGQLILSLLGILTILSRKPRTWSSLYLIIAYAGSIFLMTGRSFWVWEKIAILQTIQFPWRLLFMTTVLTPVLGYSFLALFKSRKLQLLVLSLILVLSFVNIRNYRRPIKHFSESEYTDLYLLNVGKTTTTFRTEILPKWSVPDERYKTEEVLVNSGNMTIDALTHDALGLTLTIHNKPDSSPGRITILRNYYPGWVATMDGKTKIELVPTDEGMISMLPQLGIHTYEIRMKSTSTEIIANLVSIIALLSLGVLWKKNQKRKS